MSVVDDIRKLQQDAELQAAQLLRHEEQMNGTRGQSAAIDAIAAEIKSLRRAAYWVAGVIIVGSITFAFSVLSLIGGGS